MKIITSDAKRIYFFVSFFLFSITILLTNCKKNDHTSNPSNTGVDLRQIADGFVSPIGIVAAPGNSGRLFVIDQVGKIWIIDSAGNKMATPFFDVSSSLISLNPGYDERGL